MGERLRKRKRKEGRDIVIPPEKNNCKRKTDKETDRKKYLNKTILITIGQMKSGRLSQFLAVLEK